MDKCVTNPLQEGVRGGRNLPRNVLQPRGVLQGSPEQFDRSSLTPKLNPPRTKRLELKCDTLLLTYALKFNLRFYMKAKYCPTAYVVPQPTIAPAAPAGFAIAVVVTLEGGVFFLVYSSLLRSSSSTPSSSSPSLRLLLVFSLPLFVNQDRSARFPSEMHPTSSPR